MTLIEAMVALAMAALGVTALGMVINYSMKNTAVAKVYAARDELEWRIRTLLLNHKAIDRSKVDADLKACVDGKQPGGPPCEHLAEYGFELYEPNGAMPVSGAGLQAPEEGKDYDLSGAPCPPGSSQDPRCVFRVSTWFRPYCAQWSVLPAAPDQCNGPAEYLQMYFTIKLKGRIAGGIELDSLREGVVFYTPPPPGVVP